jgi:ADP-ribose pyrophosphatase
MKKWRKLSSKTLLKHPRITVIEDTVQLPSGKETTYIKIEKTAAAEVIAIREDGKILLQKEYSYPPDEHLLQFPGGALESGETPAEGAARELAEEAGLAGTLQEIGWFYADNRRSDAQFHVFVAHDLREVPRAPDETEEFEDFWYTPNEIEALIRTNKIVNYPLLAAWSLYKAQKQK